MGFRSTISKSLRKAADRVDGGKPSTPTQNVPLSTPLWLKAMTMVGGTVLIVVGIIIVRWGYDLWNEGKPPVVAAHPSEVTAPVANEKEPVKQGGSNESKTD